MDSLIKVFHSRAMQRSGSFRNHRHSSYEISLIITGKGNYRVGNSDFSIAGGDVFLYHSDEQHCITDIMGGEPMHILNIQFEPRYFWTDDGMTDFLKAFYRRSERGENKLRNGTELCEKVKGHILNADREFEEKLPGYEQALRAEVTEIVILLMRAEGDIPKSEYDSEKLKKIGRSMDYIAENLFSKLTLADIASSAGFSRTYYCALFKSLNGISLWDYINIKRVEAAMKLLRTTDMNVLNVALSCGFNNTANFNRIFKKVTGLMPGKYR